MERSLRIFYIVLSGRCVMMCLCLTLLMTALAHNVAHGQETKISQAVDQIRSLPPSVQRMKAAMHLFELTNSKKGRKNVSDANIADIISLLDDPDMSVKYWVAATLGNIGIRAKAAVPKLIDILLKTGCGSTGKPPALAASYALKKMKVKAPSSPCVPNQP